MSVDEEVCPDRAVLVSDHNGTILFGDDLLSSHCSVSLFDENTIAPALPGIKEDRA
jgi:hypothetical protein